MTRAGTDLEYAVVVFELQELGEIPDHVKIAEGGIGLSDGDDDFGGGDDDDDDDEEEKKEEINIDNI